MLVFNTDYDIAAVGFHAVYEQLIYQIPETFPHFDSSELCPGGESREWVYFEGHCYSMFSVENDTGHAHGSITWYEAEEQCNGMCSETMITTCIY